MLSIGQIKVDFTKYFSCFKNYMTANEGHFSSNFRFLQPEILLFVSWLRFLLLYVRHVVNAQIFHCVLVSRCHKLFQRKVSSYNDHFNSENPKFLQNLHPFFSDFTFYFYSLSVVCLQLVCCLCSVITST